MTDDDLICLCFGVSRRKVLTFVRIHQPRVASQLSQCSGAGTGCGWCVPYLKKLHEATLPRSCALCGTSGDEEPNDLSAEEYAKRRDEYRRQRNSPPAD